MIQVLVCRTAVRCHVPMIIVYASVMGKIGGREGGGGQVLPCCSDARPPSALQQLC